MADETCHFLSRMAGALTIEEPAAIPIHEKFFIAHALRKLVCGAINAAPVEENKLFSAMLQAPEANYPRPGKAAASPHQLTGYIKK